MATAQHPTIGQAGPTAAEQARDQWFSSIIHSLKTDKLLLDKNIAPTETKEFYDALINDDVITVGAKTKDAMNQLLTKQAVFTFITHLLKSGHLPQRLAFDVAHSSLLVWAVVADDDYESEKALYLAQAAVNTEFCRADYRVSATVVEVSDQLPTPSHYEEVLLHGQLD
ncbi:MAG: hypothetical protein ACRYFX_19870 [Janthinobacterium lividum]